MTLTHWDPFRALRRRDDAFDDFVREFFVRGAEAIEPPVEVAETDADVIVKMVVPGVEKEHIDISVEDRSLRVHGELRKESEEKKKSYHRQEIRYGSFERVVPLPTDVDAGKSTATLKNGMLTITVAKAATTKSRHIKVAAA